MATELGPMPDCPTGLACTGCRYCETAREMWEIAREMCRYLAGQKGVCSCGD